MTDVTLFAAANMKYFMEHGYAFAKSAVDAGNYVHIVTWKDNEESWEQEQRNIIAFLGKFFETISPKMCRVQLLSHNTIKTFKDNLNILEDRAFFACVRFLMLDSVVKSEFIENNRSVMVLDIDSIINKKIEISDDYDLGVFLRTDNPQGTEYEMEGMRVAAGMLYVTARATDFIQFLRVFIVANPIRWFCDQVALFKAYDEFKDEMKILNFNGDNLDWNFEENTEIWTGKGSRKYSDPTYVARKKEIDLGLL